MRNSRPERTPAYITPRWSVLDGWRRSVYGYSLVALMMFLFLASWGAQSVSGRSNYNSQQQEHQQPQLSWIGYTQSADFWTKSLQNWQSEFLAVASISIFTVFLRQRGSPQSKPVGASHGETGVEG